MKKILEDHGGKVWATSRLGIGTIMYFVLRKYPGGTNEMSRILIIEDEAIADLEKRLSGTFPGLRLRYAAEEIQD